MVPINILGFFTILIPTSVCMKKMLAKMKPVKWKRKLQSQKRYLFHSMLAVLFCPVDMGSDNSSLLPTLLDGLKDHILSFGENEMHIAYPVQSIKAFRSVYIALKLRILTVFLWSYKIVEGWDLRH